MEWRLLALLVLAHTACGVQLYATGITTSTPWIRVGIHAIPSISPIVSLSESVVVESSWDIVSSYELVPIAAHIGGADDPHLLKNGTTRILAHNVTLSSDDISVLRRAVDNRYLLHMVAGSVPVLSYENGYRYGMPLGWRDGGHDYDGDGRVETLLFVTTHMHFDVEYDASGRMVSLVVDPHTQSAPVEARIGTAYDITASLRVAHLSTSYRDAQERVDELLAEGEYAQAYRWVQFGLVTAIMLVLFLVAYGWWRRHFRRIWETARHRVPTGGPLGIRVVRRYIMRPPVDVVARTRLAVALAYGSALLWFVVLAPVIFHYLNIRHFIVTIMAAWPLLSIFVTARALVLCHAWTKRWNIAHRVSTRTLLITQHFWVPLPLGVLLLTYASIRFSTYDSRHIGTIVGVFCAVIIGALFGSGVRARARADTRVAYACARTRAGRMVRGTSVGAQVPRAGSVQRIGARCTGRAARIGRAGDASHTNGLPTTRDVARALGRAGWHVCARAAHSHQCTDRVG